MRNIFSKTPIYLTPQAPFIEECRISGSVRGPRDNKNLPGKLLGPYRAPRKLLKRMDMPNSPEAAPRWYIAELTEEVTLEGDPTNVVHKKTRVIFADSPQDAYEKALTMITEHEIG